jgi:hypothetical protein
MTKEEGQAMIPDPELLARAVCTCTGITSQTGVDQNDGPDKVWLCDECGLIWEGVEPINYMTDPTELMRQHPGPSDR